MKENLAKKLDLMKAELEEANQMIQSLRAIIHNDLPRHSDYYSPYFNLFSQPKIDHEYLNTKHYLITLTHDPKFLSFTTNRQAINYYIKIISDSLAHCNLTMNPSKTDEIWGLHGCFELNKNQQVHAHLILSTYDDSILETFRYHIKPKLTHRLKLNVSVDIRQVSDTFMNKQTGNIGIAGANDYLHKGYLGLIYKK